MGAIDGMARAALQSRAAAQCGHLQYAERSLPLLLSLRIFTVISGALLTETPGEIPPQVLLSLSSFVSVSSLQARIIRHIGAVFHESPFFITPEEASAAVSAAATLPAHGERLSGGELPGTATVAAAIQVWAKLG